MFRMTKSDFQFLVIVIGPIIQMHSSSTCAGSCKMFMVQCASPVVDKCKQSCKGALDWAGTYPPQNCTFPQRIVDHI